MSDLKNPMRFSIRDRTVDTDYITENGSEINVTEIDIRPSEGNVYVYWE